MRKASVILALGVVFLAGLTARGDDAAPTQKSSSGASHASIADGQVREALAAELAGDDARREALLAKTLHDDPDCRAARWQSGFVLLDGKWLTPQEAATKYSADRNLAEYGRRRDQAAKAGRFWRGSVFSESVDTSKVNDPETTQQLSNQITRSDVLSPAGIAANADLARWCRSKRLVDEERVHWIQVLLSDPANSEAQTRLCMRWFMGEPRINTEIEAIKRQIALEGKERAEWKANVFRWQKSLDSGTNSEQTQAAAEMHDHKDSAIIPALESAAWADSANSPAQRDAISAFQRQAVALLGRLSVQRATYSLTQLSVLGKQAELRIAAAKELHNRNLHDFVPLLLDGLANPFQFGYSVSSDSDSLAIYSVAIVQEGRDKNRELRFVDAAPLTIRFRPNSCGPSNEKLFMFFSVPGPQEDWIQENARFADSVERRNGRSKEMNRRINLVMEFVTGEHSAHGTAPAGDSDVIPDPAVTTGAMTTADFWWNWWDKYNEMYSPDKPTEVYEYQCSRIVPATVYDPCSCFPAGTIVPTLLGPVAIEKIQIGDRVLAQDADTGELAYKPVLGTTVRPPAALVKVDTSNGTLRATRGHAFWIDGKGWQMAKQSQIGDRLHGLHGASIIIAIASSPSEAAYNLNVADFHTYFVGESGQILVHDYSRRLPTAATVPGFVANAQ